MPLRFVTASIFGLAITYALVVVMQALITQGPNTVQHLPTLSAINLVQLKRDPPQSKQKIEPLEKRTLPPPTQPKLTIRAPAPNSAAPSDYDYSIPDYSIEHSLNTDLGALGTYSEASPISRPQPLYPHQAKLKNVQGWLKIIYSVTKEGKVANIRITSEAPKGESAAPVEMFEDSIRKAMSRWRYKPLTINDIAVDQHDLELFYEFELDANS